MNDTDTPKNENTFESASEEWKEFFMNFSSLRKEVLGMILSLDDVSVLDDYLDKIKNKEKEVFSSVDDPSKYTAYHISIAGSTGPLSSPMLDFEGYNSLMDFYEKLKKELLSKETQQ